MGEKKFNAKLDAARSLLEFQMSVFQKQVVGGRGILFEHPAGATSWREPCVRAVAQLPGVYLLNFDQCRYKLTDPNGNALKKPTRLMFNMPSVLTEFSDKRCICVEKHGQCQGRQKGLRVSTFAQVYPHDLACAFAQCAWDYASTR